jgi:hypothetical protein
VTREAVTREAVTREAVTRGDPPSVRDVRVAMVSACDVRGPA